MRLPDALSDLSSTNEPWCSTCGEGTVLRRNSVINGRIAESNFVFESERATIMKNKSAFRVQGIVLIAAMPGATRSERLGADAIRMFPSDLVEVACTGLQ